MYGPMYLYSRHFLIRHIKLYNRQSQWEHKGWPHPRFFTERMEEALPRPQSPFLTVSTPIKG